MTTNESNDESSKSYDKLEIRLANYKPWHKQDADDDPTYVGRQMEEDKLLGALINLKKGRYLVTGYRGAGKTTFVNRVLRKFSKQLINRKITYKEDEHKKPKVQLIKNVLVAKVNLSQNSTKNSNNLFYNIISVLLQESRHKLVAKQKTVCRWAIGIYLLVTNVLLAIYFFDFELFGVLIFFTSLVGVYSFTVSEICLIFVVYSSVWWGGYWFTQGYKSLFSYILKIKYDFVGDLEDLLVRSHYQQLIERGQSLALASSTSVSRKSVLNSKPVSSKEMEFVLMSVLKKMNSHGIEVVYVFDELDKLEGFSSNTEGIQRVDYNTQYNIDQLSQVERLLSRLKNFVSESSASFIFIAGRELMDSFLSERGSTDSLYETFFDQTISIDSLLTESSETANNRLSSMIEMYICKHFYNPDDPYFNQKNGDSTKSGYSVDKKKFILSTYRDKLIWSSKKYNNSGEINERVANYIIYVLRNFISYLTFYSWGNPKRLAFLVDSFVEPKKCTKNKEIAGYYLVLKYSDLAQFIFASQIFSIYQHHLSTKVTKTSDKLTVTTLSALHFILKFHKLAFSRESFYRMAEAINVHRSPEFNDVVDGLLSLVLPPFQRRIRNGTYRYRFLSGFEQEIRFITYRNELESASFNFSLNQMTAIKQYYSDISSENGANIAYERRGLAKFGLILGDIYSAEEEYDRASWEYSKAIETLRHYFFREDGTVIDGHIIEDETLLVLVEAMLKNGDLEERRQNYHKAAAIYLGANKQICGLLENHSSSIEHIIKKDSKWELIREAFWAYQFLALKRSHRVVTEQELKTKFNFNFHYADNDARFKFKQGGLLFFLGDVKKSAEKFVDTVKLCEEMKDGERKAFLEASAIVKYVECMLAQRSIDIVDRFARSNSTDYIRGVTKNMSEFFGKMGNYSSVANFVDDLENKKFKNRSLSFSPRSEDFFSLFTMLLQAASIFRSNGLSLHASITYMRAIFYFAMIADFLKKRDKRIIKNNMGNYEKLRRILLEKAIYNINDTRQLKSSHFISTFMYRDIKFNAVKEGSRVFDDSDISDIGYLFNKGTEENIISNPLFWQHSILMQKTLVASIWMRWVLDNCSDEGLEKGVFAHIDPDNIAPFSIRYKIFLRWLYCRHHIKLLNIKLKKKLDISSCKGEDKTFYKIYCECVALEAKVIKKIIRHTNLALDEVWQFTYNDQDLIFPMMTQIYYVQWKLLYTLAKYGIDNLGSDKPGIRDVSKSLQYALLSNLNNNSENDTDNEIVLYSQDEEETELKLSRLSENFDFKPSSLDLLQVKDKALAYLSSVGNVTDPTSRTKTKLLQNKYYAHDDFSDPEFNLDWTLLQMLAPNAKFLKKNILNKMNTLCS